MVKQNVEIGYTEQVISVKVEKVGKDQGAISPTQKKGRNISRKGIKDRVERHYACDLCKMS